MVWYEEEIELLQEVTQKVAADHHVAFYGSSSIRLWERLEADFGQLKPLNLGFGGSTLAACVWFFERVLLPVRPQMLVVYAGDNDLGDGRLPEEVLIYFQQLTAKVRQHFGDIPMVYLSIKPSIARLNIAPSIRRANNLIKNEIKNSLQPAFFLDLAAAMVDAQGQPRRELFQPDGLHLSAKGYEVWTEKLQLLLSTELGAFFEKHPR